MDVLKKTIVFILFSLWHCNIDGMPEDEKDFVECPRIINIINFIRQTDYRIEDSDRLMYETVCEQVKLLNKYALPATFLLQYDALINPLYQDLLKNELNGVSEVGAWWELTQPHVEAAGLKWRGKYSWVSTANIGFSTGYTQAERERLVDVYMCKFKEVFGYYPKSVGSWYIDSHTLTYMYDKYHIDSSCNCKDQIGTDGYTLWGGYWNQAYYPSKLNGYMPAQTEKGQIPVPIFRMLGSDPLYQYDDGLGEERQGVISLEPVYAHAGMSREWVDYFFESIINEPCLAFNYAQAGQENSFTWPNMRKGLEMQIPIIDSLFRMKKIRVETLGESGRWFKSKYKVTPATAVTVWKDIRKEGNKTIWYNSRYYRANLLWERGAFRFRDIHLFNENCKSAYLDMPGMGDQFLFHTLPLMDGFFWSDAEDRAGLRIIKFGKGDVTEGEVGLSNPKISEAGKSALSVTGEDDRGNLYQILLCEDKIEVSASSIDSKTGWCLELNAAAGKDLPFMAIGNSKIEALFDGFHYTIECVKGHFTAPKLGDGYVFRILPENNCVSINCRLN